MQVYTIFIIQFILSTATKEYLAPITYITNDFLIKIECINKK